MINAILADDEPIIIRGLKKLLPWEELGIRIIGEAWTGRGLIELVQKEGPSLVITDISMPDGTGIDVLKAISRLGCKTKVIFISAYQEFSYAKEALALGAVDYLVKPIEKELLLSAVKRALSLLKEESEDLQFKNKLALYEHKDRKTQLEELFDCLIDGDIRKKEAEEKLRMLDSGCDFDFFTVMLLEPELHKTDARWGEHEKRLLLFAVSNMAEELMSCDFAGVLVRRGDRICAVINHKEEAPIKALALEIVMHAASFLKITLSAGIGQEQPGAEGIRSTYQTATEALNRIFFTDGGKVVCWSEEDWESCVSARELGEARNKVLQTFLKRDRELMHAACQALLEKIEGHSGGSREKTILAAYGTITEWAGGLAEIGIVLDETELQLHLNAMQSFTKYEQIKAYIREIAAGIFQRLEPAGKDTQQLKTVKDYIENHYMDNITLEGVASKIFMNPYYFSSFFKKHTRMNFKQYLTEVRMKQAVKLLLQTDMMVYQIAEEVGYNNARQFSDMFKKHYGKLPQEFRNMAT
ncbi:two-component system, response regulator YesN [Paenibacillus algorifonticola]|uniref:Two-component system, response regulator YesN n=1 Tax=Paenibacillus algorifonticola TaxID=684063 RepID=A0A1I2IBM5_9BACL|nr:response regulator [Paenibacillus algorifonticola]SFF39769.1 two-component system, response regulator YesN [Paenibacillus algorifonticola]